jgi:PAS domain S-box-containing protein
LRAIQQYLAAPAGAALLRRAGSLAIVYFLAAQFGLSLLARPSDVAVFWPASGIAAGFLIVSGRRAYPALAIGVVIGTVAANLLSDRSLFTSVFKGFCNAGEAMLVAWLLARWFGPTFRFDDVRRVLGFFAAAGLAAAASAVGGAITMTMSHTTAPFFEVWRAWFLSDGVGIVVVAPFVVGLGQLRSELPPRGELIEGGAILGLLVLTSMFILSHPTTSWVSFSPGALVLPMLLWMAARCHPTLTIAGALVVSSAAICATIFGLGRFGDAAIPILERVKGAQVAATMVTAYTLVLGALFTERRQREMALKMALDGAKLGAFSANLATGHLECDLRAAMMHGHNVPPATIKESRRFVHRDDLIRIDAALAKARGTGAVWNAEYRVMHPPNHPHAGETRWVAAESSIVCDQRGTPIGLLGVTRDITERKRTERALAERDLQLALAGKSARVGTFAYDVDAGRMQISDGYAAIHGFPEGTTEIACRQWQLGVHPEDLVRWQELRRLAFSDRRREYSWEYRVVRPEGEIRWIEARVFVSYGSNGCAQRVVGVDIDITTRKQAEAHQSTLLAELDHRVKNVLATVSAIIVQTPKANSSLADYVAGLGERISSLARTHELLSHSRWHGVSLEEIAQRELAPYLADNAEIGGPHVTLKAEAAPALGMVLHELATNAAKHGAFSKPGGRLLLQWRWLGNASPGRLIIDWQEFGGLPDQEPSQPGYGTSIIRELIPFELGGTADLSFASAGLRCRLEIPVDWVSEADHALGSAPTSSTPISGHEAGVQR